MSEALLAAKRRLLNEDDDMSYESSKRSLHEDDKKHHKKRKKEKKEKKKKKSKKKARSSSDSSSSSVDSDTWVEAASSKKSDNDHKPVTLREPSPSPKTEPLKRDDWMTMAGLIATFTRDDIKPKRDVKKKNIDDYNPATSVRELNPFWKDGGTGLPSDNKPKELPRKERHEESKDYLKSRTSDERSGFRKLDYKNTRGSSFRKPNYRDDYSNNYSSKNKSNYENDSGYRSSRKSWQKRDYSPKRRERSRSNESSPENHKRLSETIHPSISSSDSHPGTSSQSLQDDKQPSEEKSAYLTDQEMNAIGAKIVKAEIMGNTILIAELQAKLNAAREYKKANPDVGKKQEAVMLTLADEKGNVRPLTKSHQVGDPRSKGGKKKITTHAVTGERTRFFEDDDKYSLSQMFEREKFGSSQDAEKEFVEAVSKHKNPNDDLDDIFAEKITKKKSDARIDEENKRKAIAQHKTTQKWLENCDFCIDSGKMLKHMIASLGTKAYVALPAKRSLTEGHCYIATVGHVTCSTMADEDVWEEILTYRRALTRLFNSRDEDVVFFETATHFHKYPHLVINCVPLPRDVGDSAPIYFKKAIMECETEWSNNKKVVDLKGKDVRKGVPQRLPYFWVDFGMDPGFAHVIEDQNLFPTNFAQEIVGGMLDLDHTLWRKPQRDNFESQRKKVLEFETMWREFDPKPTS